MRALGTHGAGRGLSVSPGGSLCPSPGSGQKLEAKFAPSAGQNPLGDRRGQCQRRRWGTQAPCGRMRAKPALQTQRKEPLVLTQRSLLHRSPRWFNSRHSSMSTQRAREASSWKPPGHSHTAPPGRGTQRPLTQRHSSESSSELSSSEKAGIQTSTPPPADGLATPPLSLPLLTSRGLPQ